ncbi:putative Cytochrome P450 monooxygenase [Taphrina deformans PYCC 5710]|uniref:Cytochrome P450 monooxygenase n=1 Tax=Taphrina deformans (strain PYCC 5710 / ATCC 11124 / CBS 356.35 / IMI 108563 / JCM 9778 / NBRC 8474) TaxID=1097556 RepID=R4X7D1_TAPDE|nr:putative Cytochrome P450 monooxygenase [Taphrina deformans PYCC 5710]|eukprot:CCG80988.1 putative Cytochrome P450 monooxygenase [Taphrina deformans PYCC 5710]
MVAEYLAATALLGAQVLNHFDKLVFQSYFGTICVLHAAAAFSYYIVWRMFLWRWIFSPLRGVGGPKSHWFYGNFREIFKEDIGVPHIRWMKAHHDQPFIRYFGLFGYERVLVNSLPALQHILTNCYDFPKSGNLARAIKTILGAEGILFAEGDIHKRQRKQMNPSFSYAKLKSMSPIFWSKAQQMVEAWSGLLETTNEIEVVSGLSAATLDIIGSAGFGTEFNAIGGLTDPTIRNKLASAYADLFDVKKTAKVLGVVTFYLPWVRRLPLPRHLELNRDIKVIQTMSQELISSKVERTNRGEDIGNDIFALLLKDNKRKEAAKDPNDPPMTLREIGDQTMTLLAAGHETTSAGTAWALYALSIDQTIQDRLRAELTSAIEANEEPSFEKIESLHYLNNFTKEVLRFYPPVPMTLRTATVTTVVDGVSIPAGTDMFISPIATNRNIHIWGPDAESFNPDRWDNLPSTHNNYGMETFLHGARGCIGQRFAVVEMKCLIAAMLINLKFEPKPNHVVKPQSSITMRPHGGLPLILTRL